ncbi:protein suppressor of white apricot [Calliphora vicina]|uniref:protein suppressor of white apricot n=1 Tax=Calliphora vicina TaxID=7373 RepID=UPI00325B3A79
MPFNTRHNYNTRHEYATANAGNIGSNSSNIGGVNAVNGILRKVNGSSSGSSLLSSTTNANEVRHVDLLVFGYACKVFRDDGKARDIDQGKHLIPWMGDNNLKIDRYDVRGALYDLTPYEPPPGGYGNRLDYLTAEEQRAEQLCEEERYLFLYSNEEDVITKQEEELKRLQQETNGSSYSQVGFAYDPSQQIGPNREEFFNSPTCEEAEQAFQLPYNFQVPDGMQLPETMKQHAIIEKTARFIASQGVQMEILLKAKQSNNAQFEFLSRNSILNPYYKYVVSSIKDGTYPQHTEAKEKDNKDTDNANGNTLVSVENVVVKPVVTVPTIKYKPSADCAYTQLISKIKGVPLSELHDESSRQSLASQQESANNSPSLTPVLLQYNGATFITEQDDNSNSNMTVTQSSGDNLNDSQPKVEILKNSSALALAQNYSSDSETEEETVEEAKEKTPPKLEFPLPPESLQNIIDKTAVYVIKNGRQFEETLRSKSVERFTFLLPDNEYYPYYMYKITGDSNAASKEQKKRKAKEVAEALLSKKGLSGDKTAASAATNPVSFSIKTKEENVANVTLQQPALPQEHSDEEDKPKTNTSAAGTQRHVPEHVQKAIQLVESQLMARNAQLAATLALRQTPLASTTSTTNSSIKSLSTCYESDKFPNKLTNPAVAITTSTSNTSKTEAERNALFEQQQQQRHKELKKAEEKVKDKLAQIAREKLGGLISKEKQLQLERKRKAMAFLNQIKVVSKTDNDSEADPTKKPKSNNEDEGNNSDDSEVSVHSIPITSYGPNSDDELDSKLENKLVTPTPPSPPHISTKSKELAQHKTATVNVSDDDEVELISEIKPREMYSKRRSRSISKDILITSTLTRRHYRKHDKRTPSTESILSSNNEYDEDEENEGERGSHRSKSKSHKSKKSKTKKSSKSKKKSKKRSRSKTRTRSRSRSRSHHQSHHSERHRRRSRSRSNNHDEYYKQAISERERERERQQRKRSSHTPSRSNYSSSYSRSHKDKSRSHRYD